MRQSPLSLPKCGCSDRSTGDRVFTCPVCVAAALRYWDGDRVDQCELFDHVDSASSVSGSVSGEGLTPIADVLRSLAVADGLPF